MKKVIIIRYSEIHLKGNNRGFFENALLTNIKKSLSDLKCELLRQQGRYLIVDFDECDECAIIDRLKKVFIRQADNLLFSEFRQFVTG